MQAVLSNTEALQCSWQADGPALTFQLRRRPPPHVRGSHARQDGAVPEDHPDQQPLRVDR